MALNLDARQRAMLQDMGITFWGPSAPPAAVPAVAAAAPAEASALPAAVATPAAPAAEAAPQPPTAVIATATATATAPDPQPERAAPIPPAMDAATTAPQAASADAAPAHATPVYRAPAAASAPWFMAPLVHAYAESAAPDAPDAGWLVLVECADPADPWAGDAGALLNNMLRALRLQQHPQVRIAPLTRQAPGSAAGHPGLEPLAPALQAALATHRPARVLVLGLHAARAVLQRSEALGPLRAELHQLHGVPAVVSYDPAYLLRAPHAKPGAWADLCRAHALQPPAH
ncbi:uracil-DNA glycosylase family protein [Comamonas terrigena]|jgi:DNA polymerase|uniref:uracil-DNA glycosylase family protein n=1 Tax=Comamonas terrigena TaxID=32013 RepID=UPI00244AF7AA|nr:uracil-DNA glycosylase family protein [Comamonas terrigena]MDH0048542.1 hypothetical protein [Comamonas terrigena]MDH0511522.1 hypothetical protein [Comamonas terrigena]MDH1091019.1 hypothetical protein [Comamonas terrigena]